MKCVYGWAGGRVGGRAGGRTLRHNQIFLPMVLRCARASRPRELRYYKFLEYCCCIYMWIMAKMNEWMNEQVNELCVILNVKPKKLSRSFYLISNSWLYPRRRPRWRPCFVPPVAPPPIKYISSCWEDQRLFTEGKIVSKYCNISKPPGRGSINPLFCHGGGIYEFACTSEG